MLGVITTPLPKVRPEFPSNEYADAYIPERQSQLGQLLCALLHQDANNALIVWAAEERSKQIKGRSIGVVSGGRTT